MIINKQVSEKELVAILLEAKKRGWRTAKFYFMVGLPLNQDTLVPEEEEIAIFIERVAQQTRMHFNINVGTFVPKPHTPFQWSKQITREEAEKKLFYIRSRLKIKGHKVGIQDPLISVIEGLASRGDERAGELFFKAYKRGCRLDSWNEYLKREIWEELLSEYRLFVDEILTGINTNESLPWNCIFSNVSNDYFQEEFNKSCKGESTSLCMNNCKKCKVCDNEKIEIVQNNIHDDNCLYDKNIEINIKNRDPDTHRILFSFSKNKNAVFYSHLSLLEIFSMTFIRGQLPIFYTQGFNPLPKLEIASPLTLGIRSRAEIATIDTVNFYDSNEFKDVMNSYFPEGLEIIEARNISIPSGNKKVSVMSLLWGFEYIEKNNCITKVEVKEEKAYRSSRINNGECLFDLERYSVLAKDINTDTENATGVSYFDVFKKLYERM